MTREEAIEELERLLMHWDLIDEGIYDLSEHDKDAVEIALTALRPVSREQVEKVWRGKWQVCFEDWRKQIAGDQCSKCGFQHYGTSINLYKFCPNCGAPMTDEAVEMVIERMEALRDGN